MNSNQTRRKFLRYSSQMAVGIGLMSLGACNQRITQGAKTEGEETPNTSSTGEAVFKISLAQWSLNKSLFGGKLDNLDFARKAKEDFGVEAVEYVNQFFKDKAKDESYIKEMIKRADDLGVKNVLIMIDGEGNLGAADQTERMKAVENHYKWVDAAKMMGCHSIRVNAAGRGTAEEVAAAAVDGLGRLSEYAAKTGLNVLVENHGGYSSDGSWLSGVMKQVNMDNCGTLPDFGNFCVKRKQGSWDCEEEYDRYKGVQELMPFAKAVSAKSHEFDINGNEVHTDYKRMLQIVKDAGYSGYIGIEYEGSQMKADDGIRYTKKLIEKYSKELGMM